MTKRVIFNADDYGRTSGVSAGIREAHLQGVVRSTSALMNRLGIAEELERARQECPDLEIGVHLVVTGGMPVLPVNEIRTVTGGLDEFPGLRIQRGRLREIDPNEVAREWRAQIERYVQATGRPPLHLDSHHHFSYYTPELFDHMLGLAAEYGCTIRNPIIPPPGGEITAFYPDTLVNVRRFVPPLLDSFPKPTPQYFCDGFYEEDARLEVLTAQLDRVPDGGTVEFMCHPGYADALLMDPSYGSVYNAHRAIELGILTSPDLKAYLAAHGFEVISYRDLCSGL